MLYYFNFMPWEKHYESDQQYAEFAIIIKDTNALWRLFRYRYYAGLYYTRDKAFSPWKVMT